MNGRSDSLKAPGAALLALEARAPWEFGATLAAWPVLRFAPRGDGHTVMVFPGFGASDITTLPLRAFLMDRGYDTYGWDLRFNLEHALARPEVEAQVPAEGVVATIDQERAER